MKRKLTKIEWLLLVVPCLFALFFAGWRVLQSRIHENLARNLYVPRVVVLLGGEPRSIAFAPDGKTFAVAVNSLITDWRKLGLATGEVRVYDAVSGKELRVFAQANRVNALAFSPSGDKLMVAQKFWVRDKMNPRDFNTKSQVVLYDFQSKNIEKTIRIAGEGANSLAFLPDGKNVLLNNSDNAQIWDIQKSKLIKSLAIDGANVPVVVSPGGQKIVCGYSSESSAAKISIYSLRHLQKLRDIHCVKGMRGAEVLAFSPNGRYLVSSGINNFGKSTIFDTRTWTKTLLRIEPESVEAIAFSPDNKLIAFGFHNGEKMQIVNLQSKKTLVIKTTAENFHKYQGGKMSVQNCASAVLFSPDGKTLLHRGTDRIKLWDVSSLR